MKKQLNISSVAQLPDIAQQILTYCAGSKTFAITGEMGSGKTTLITALCRVLGVQELVSSPTFAIVNEYTGKEKVLHLDLYRLKSIEEALEIGIDEYLSENMYCFIEWPQLIEPLLLPEVVRISIEVVNKQERLLTIEKS